MANLPEVFATDPAEIATEVDLGAGKHLSPEALFMEPYQWVALAMAVLIAIMIWKKVPGMITGGLDKQIAAIRAQLDEAKLLRAEAETLRDEYSAKIAGAEIDAQAMLDNARTEADALIVKAEADSKTMIERRKQMAEDKIASAERSAIEEVRQTAAMAAAAASRDLIAEKHNAAADRVLADQVIASF